MLLSMIFSHPSPQLAIMPILASKAFLCEKKMLPQVSIEPCGTTDSILLLLSLSHVVKPLIPIFFHFVCLLKTRLRYKGSHITTNWDLEYYMSLRPFSLKEIILRRREEIN